MAPSGISLDNGNSTFEGLIHYYESVLYIELLAFALIGTKVTHDEFVTETAAVTPN